MRKACKAKAAQMVEIIKFSFHVVKGGIWRAARNAAKKLAYHARLTLLIFVQVNMVGGRQLIHPKLRGTPMDTELRQDVATQVFIERVVLGEMPDVVHSALISIAESLPDLKRVLYLPSGFYAQVQNEW